MKKAAQYILSAYSFLFTQPLDKILNIGYLSLNGNPIPSFDENLLLELCTEAKEVLEKEKNILKLQGDFIIVGDIHGSLHDLLRILKFIHENQSKVLFLGDYVDRGDFSLECITILFAMKVMQPDNFFLLRGNHEFNSICSQHGFKSEILNYHNPKRNKKAPIAKQTKQVSKPNSFIFPIEEEPKTPEDTNDSNNEYYANYTTTWCYKYTESLYDAFVDSFSYLPISAILNGKTFCIHGGLSPKLKNINSLDKQISKPIKTFEESKLLSDVVWSDPSENFESLFIENPRGLGYLFNEYSLMNFLNDNSLFRMIRAHQCVQNGSLFQFEEKCITVFSASCYHRFSENLSAVLHLFEKDDTVKVTTFPPITRLQKSDAIYYKVEALNKNGEVTRNYMTLRHPKLIASSTVRIVAKHRVTKIRPFVSDNSISLRNSNLVPGSCTITTPKLTTNIRKPRQVLAQSESEQKIDAKRNMLNIDHNAPSSVSQSLFSLADLLGEK